MIFDYILHKCIPLAACYRNLRTITHHQSAIALVLADQLNVDEMRLVDGVEAVGLEQIYENANVVRADDTTAIGQVNLGVFLPAFTAYDILYGHKIVGLGAWNSNLGFLIAEMIEVVPQVVVKLNFLPILNTNGCFVYGFDEVLGVDRLEEVVDSTDLERIQRVVVESGNENNFKIDRFYLLKQLKTIATRHCNVEE